MMMEDVILKWSIVSALEKIGRIVTYSLIVVPAYLNILRIFDTLTSFGLFHILTFCMNSYLN